MSIALLNVPKPSNTPRLELPVTPQAPGKVDFHQALQTARRAKPTDDRVATPQVGPPVGAQAAPSDPAAPEAAQASAQPLTEGDRSSAAKQNESAPPLSTSTSDEQPSPDITAHVTPEVAVIPISVPSQTDTPVEVQTDNQALSLPADLISVPVQAEPDSAVDVSVIHENTEPVSVVITPVDLPREEPTQSTESAQPPAPVVPTQPVAQTPTPQPDDAEPNPPQTPNGKPAFAVSTPPTGRETANQQQDTPQKGQDASQSSMGRAMKPASPQRPESLANIAPVGSAAEKATAPTTTSPVSNTVEAPVPPTPQAVVRPSPLEAPAPTPQPSMPPEARFAQANHTGIVTSIRGQLLPNGGTMQIRLDPPELGALQVTVRVIDGMISASFQTSNDQATRLLSHSLAQLKSALQTTGVNVDRLSVQQSKPDEQSAQQDHRQGSWDDQHNARQEQHRREALRRMWRRLGVDDPLDMIA